jgi:hypothetical protein
MQAISLQHPSAAQLLRYQPLSAQNVPFGDMQIMQPKCINGRLPAGNSIRRRAHISNICTNARTGSRRDTPKIPPRLKLTAASDCDAEGSRNRCEPDVIA